MKIKHYFYQLVDRLLSKPQEFHAFIVMTWLTRWGSRPLQSSSQSTMVFSPHQDDETLGCGGMIALKRQQQVTVSVIFLTDGRNSHVYSPWLTAPDNIIEIRQQESIAALSMLNVPASNVHFLNHIDGSLQDLLHHPQPIVNQITELLLQDQPTEIYVPHRHDRHPDHEATYQFVKAAIAQSQIQTELLQYPIWLCWESLAFFQLKSVDLAHAFRLSVQTVQAQKQQAIEAYQSQRLLLPPGMLKSYLMPYEIFFKDL